ncbi:hypothetical protein ACFSCZ_19105, partial [Siminovitchia sediminis]
PFVQLRAPGARGRFKKTNEGKKHLHWFFLQRLSPLGRRPSLFLLSSCGRQALEVASKKPMKVKNTFTGFFSSACRP